MRGDGKDTVTPDHVKTIQRLAGQVTQLRRALNALQLQVKTDVTSIGRRSAGMVLALREAESALKATAEEEK